MKHIFLPYNQLVTFRILNIGLDKTTFSTSTELINLNTPTLLHQISSVFSTVEVKSQTNCARSGSLTCQAKVTQ